MWYKSFLYQAAGWTKARRVAAKVEFHFGGLLLRGGFIVANLEADSHVEDQKVVAGCLLNRTREPKMGILDHNSSQQARLGV